MDENGRKECGEYILSLISQARSDTSLGLGLMIDNPNDKEAIAVNTMERLKLSYDEMEKLIIAMTSDKEKDQEEPQEALPDDMIR